MMALLQKGGFFMLPLLICSIIMVAVIIERCLVFFRMFQKPLFEYNDPPVIIKKLRCHLMIIYTIIVIAPMLGLLGTVVGLMKCFHLLGSASTAIFDPKVMSLGISEALLTTAAGLTITVIATIFYNYFNTCLDNYVMDYNDACARMTTLNQALQEGNKDE
jgi:Biopolymer transport proteins